MQRLGSHARFLETTFSRGASFLRRPEPGLDTRRPEDRLALDVVDAFAEQDIGDLVGAQAAAFVADHRHCGACGRRLSSKGRASFRFRTPFGDVPVTGPRLKRCRCDSPTHGSFSPLTGLFTEHTAPEMLCLETKWASLVPFGVTVKLLKDVLPVGTTRNAHTIPNYAERHRYGERVSTAFAESTVNAVVGKRFAKRQQMRWSKRGAHLILQTRTRVLDDTLRAKFHRSYPGLFHMQAPDRSEHNLAA